jgi:drug/metabolite transporter (DMT)-like permease
LIVVAAVMWSTSGFFAKAPLFGDWPLMVDGVPTRGPLLAFWRALFAAAVLLPFVRRPRWTIKLVPMLLAYVAMNFTFLNALTLTNEGNAIWLQHTAPVWVFLFSAVLFGEVIQRHDWLLLVFCIAGVGLILLHEIQGQSLLGIVNGLLSGFFYAAIVLSLRHLRDEDNAWLVMLNNLVTAVAFLPLLLYFDIWPAGRQMLYLVGFGMFQMGLPYLLFARGLRSVPGHEASGIVLLEPVLVPVWVYIAWSHSETYQSPQWWTLVGGTFILFGLAVRYIGKN